MGTEPVIHLIGSREGHVGLLLDTAVSGGARVRHWTTAPAPEQVRPGDQIVVDLTAGEPSGWSGGDGGDGGGGPDAIARLTQAADVWLVTGVELVPGSWLTLSRDPRVRLVSPGSGPDPLAGLVKELAQQVQAPTGAEVARLVLERTPLLDPVAPFVTAVCEQPWRVRRPHDLAAAVGLSRHRVLQSCRALGFERVEHFITAVRMVALSLLTAERRLSLAVARHTLGITDTSNARRQLERARHRSGAALRQLKVLVA
jgi:hypothetical protein